MKSERRLNFEKPLILSVLIVAVVFVSVGCASAASSPLFTYTGDVLPSADGWIIVDYPAYESTGAHVEDGVLHFTDFSSGSGSAIHYRREWPISPDFINVAEFDLKVVSCSELYGIWIGTSDDDYNMFYTIFPDRIQSNYRNLDFVDHLGEVYYFNTTSQFNTYKAVIDNGIAKLYINGELVLEQPAGIGTHYLANINSVGFGSASSPATGEAYFDEVRAYQLPSLPFTYTGDILPSADGWIIVGYASYESTGAHIENGTLHITDLSSAPGTCIHYRREWPISLDYINVAEFDLKVVSCSELYGIWIGTSDDDYNMFYTIFPDRIQSNYRNLDFVDHLGEVYYFDTASQFNTYKAVIDNGIAKLYINGELVLEQPAGIGTYYLANINSVGFGSASSPATGEAYFDEVRAYILVEVFDTEAPANPYPSIMGTHNGTIKPTYTINVSNLYTYPCTGTGGHTEYAKIWNSTWNATATWSGYKGDWKNITFDKTVILLANKTYNYTIRTGSYPQIHHTKALLTANGWINCTEFTDANGKTYNNWIPAIRLE